MNNILLLTLTSLKERLIKTPIIKVQRELGYTFECSFVFYHACTEERINEFTEETAFKIPPDYREFLLIHDGAILFQDESGRSNPSWKIFGIDDIIDYMNIHHTPEHLYPIATYGQTVIFVNGDRVNEGREDYLFDRSIYDSIDSEGEDIKLNFELFFERLIVSQGSHFWFWNEINATNYSR
ncbi:SMI1/KNR4 family protein [Paenibacillus lupini]|uniref:SMI1/KNR4 family protein n=1 Tax=Paenibacillus lupini TaxID=1450204 RepID=UPI001421C686|nr:SMI1/KNR4 family protein [Paenibacillus lupini]NIK21974.1 hypothetical protein [Paenibacillus lupini]